MTHICELANRGVIHVGGDDRRSFLQGLISNDIELCKPGSPIYAALLTPQGKFLHDMFIVDEGKNFLIDCEAARADDLLKRLNAHKLRSKVVLASEVSEYTVLAVWAGDATLSLANFMQPPEKGHEPDAYFYQDPRHETLGMRAIVAKNVDLPDDRVNFDFYDRHRLSLGIPDGSRDMIVEKSTLLECNMDKLNAISWTKGCYMGQELTARMHYRGLTKKHLFPVKIEGPSPAAGTVIKLGDEEIGEMRSSCGDLGLALLNVEKAHERGIICGKSRLATHISRLNKD